MPRRTRTESMRRRDAYMRKLREEELAALRLVLRRAWHEYVRASVREDGHGKQ